MKKITITNAYTWYNKGDAGILLGTVNAIKNIYGEDIEINILSFTPDEDRKRYCKDKFIKNVYSNVLNPYPFKKSFIGRKTAISKLFFQMIYNYVCFNIFRERFVSNSDNLRVLKESDLIVVCGGGFLGGKKFNSLIHLYQIYINSSFGIPTILLGTSIEPFKNEIVKYCTEKQLKKLTHIFSREAITNNYLINNYDKTKFTLIPDMAFMLEDVNEKFDFIDRLKNKYDNIFGLTVREWSFPNLERPDLAKENYINVIKELIEYYSEKINAVFVFIPQVIFDGDDDSITIEKIKNKLNYKYKDNLIIYKNDWTPVEIKSLISNFDMFIGTRMHSNIFATSMAVPTVAIAYEKKTNGIMETVGLKDFVIDIDTITTKKTIKKIDICYSNRYEISKMLKNRIVEIRKEILDKIEFIKSL